MEKNLEAIKYHWDIIIQLVEKVYAEGIVTSLETSKALNQSIDFLRDTLFNDDCEDCKDK